MNTYQNLQQKALGLAFILAPLLMAIGTAAFALGIGMTPSGNNSWVSGIFWSYGFLIMIPMVIKFIPFLQRDKRDNQAISNQLIFITKQPAPSLAGSNQLVSSGLPFSCAVRSRYCQGLFEYFNSV